VAEVAKAASLAGRFLRDESAASLVEYGLVVGLVSITAIGALIALRSRIADIFNRISTALSST
jgi:pilus assembly protein Flp/PilA